MADNEEQQQQPPQFEENAAEEPINGEQPPQPQDNAYAAAEERINEAAGAAQGANAAAVEENGNAEVAVVVIPADEEDVEDVGEAQRVENGGAIAAEIARDIPEGPPEAHGGAHGNDAGYGREHVKMYYDTPDGEPVDDQPPMLFQHAADQEAYDDEAPMMFGHEDAGEGPAFDPPKKFAWRIEDYTRWSGYSQPHKKRPNFVHAKSLKRRYACGLCSDIVVVAYQTPCGVRVCRSCAEIKFRGNALISCPVSHEDEEDGQMVVHSCQEGIEWWDLTKDNATIRMLLQQICYCRNTDYGCWATPTWKVLDDHEIQCMFAPVLCPNTGCGEQAASIDMPTHVSQCCYKDPGQLTIKGVSDKKSLKTETCPNAGCRGVFNKHYSVAHMNKCGYALVPCRYCIQTVKRMDLQGHQASCPFVLEQCPNNGCREEHARNEMNTHMEHCPVRSQQMTHSCLNVACAEASAGKYKWIHAGGCLYQLHPCNFCGASFELKDIQQHYQACQQTLAWCNGCGIEFPTNELLRMHTRTQANCALGAGKCYYCPMEFETNGELRAHLRDDLPKHMLLVSQQLTEAEKRMRSDSAARDSEVKRVWNAACKPIETLMATDGHTLAALDRILDNPNPGIPAALQSIETVTVQLNLLESNVGDLVNLVDAVGLNNVDPLVRRQDIMADNYRLTNNIQTLLEDYPIAIPHTAGHAIWKIPNYCEKKQKCVADSGAFVRSHVFYSHPNGYKLSCSAFLNGAYSAMGTHLSVLFTIHKGLHDDLLEFPFRRLVRITLLSVTDSTKNRIGFIHPDASTAFQRPGDTSSPSKGLLDFVPLEVVESADYYANDAIYLRIQVGL